jgi:hypothetical protein
MLGLRLYCHGGAGDGAEWVSTGNHLFNDQGMYCNGGINDGVSWSFSGGVTFGYGIWTGIANTDWYDKSNWKHNIIPDVTISVVIPSGCIHYPSITRSLSINSTEGQIHCRGLHIQNGAVFNTASTLNVKGQMCINGNYINTTDNSLSQQINSGGILTVNTTGLMRLGNQSSGQARTDLQVNNGGVLTIDGGTLEIDDQLHVNAGGELNVTCGIVFVHKHGWGDDYTSSQPGAIVIQNGTKASITGGTIKVCGRQSVGKYHAITIYDPGFQASGSNTLEIVHGDHTTPYDCGIYAIDNAIFQNIKINKPGSTVSLNSDINIQGTLIIEDGSKLNIKDGAEVVVGD